MRCPGEARLTERLGQLGRISFLEGFGLVRSWRAGDLIPGFYRRTAYKATQPEPRPSALTPHFLLGDVVIRCSPWQVAIGS